MVKSANADKGFPLLYGSTLIDVLVVILWSMHVQCAGLCAIFFFFFFLKIHYSCATL